MSNILSLQGPVSCFVKWNAIFGPYSHVKNMQINLIIRVLCMRGLQTTLTSEIYHYR